MDRDALRAGHDWAEKIFAEVEQASAVLFLASEAALEPGSFCYKELHRARGVTITVTLGGLKPDDERLFSALPHGATVRQITEVDAQPTIPFPFVSPIDGSTSSVNLNGNQVSSIAETLRDIGIAPNSFVWTPSPEGPYPGLRALEEGDEAIFFGRDSEIRDCIRALEDTGASSSDQALLIQAPSGAGKSSFLRAGLWKRLRRHAMFTPTTIVRARSDVLFHESWGLVAGLAKKEANHLGFSYADIESAAQSNLTGLLQKIVEADSKSNGDNRVLLIGIDQAEELTGLDDKEAQQCARLFSAISNLSDSTKARLVLTARDDSIEDTLVFLERYGFDRTKIKNFRLNQMAPVRFQDVIRGPALVARNDFPINLTEKLITELASKAADSKGTVGDALPILALSLNRLIKKHRSPDGEISLNASDASQFIADAVESSMKEAIRVSRSSNESLAQLVIPQLVIWDPRAGESGAAKRCVAKEQNLFSGNNSSLKPLSDALVESRLLTKTATSGETSYEVAHEALLRTQPLSGLIIGMRANFLKVDVLKLECQEWEEYGRNIERVARSGERLKEATELLKDDYFGKQLLSEQYSVTDYLDACSDADRKLREQRERLEKMELAAASGLTEERLKRSLETYDQVTDFSRPKIYITYSRPDVRIVEDLRVGLDNAGFETFVDMHDIYAGEHWESRLGQLIASSDTILFLMSNKSVTSDSCIWELRHALKNEKRVIPILVETILSPDIPEELKSLNYIFYRDADDKATAFTRILEALGTDLSWFREATELSEKAARWVSTDKNFAVLLRGIELTQAQIWSDNVPHGQHVPEVVSDFIEASEQAKSNEELKGKKVAYWRRAFFVTLTSFLAALGLWQHLRPVTVYLNKSQIL